MGVGESHLENLSSKCTIKVVVFAGILIQPVFNRTWEFAFLSNSAGNLKRMECGPQGTQRSCIPSKTNLIATTPWNTGEKYYRAPEISLGGSDVTIWRKIKTLYFTTNCPKWFLWSGKFVLWVNCLWLPSDILSGREEKPQPQAPRVLSLCYLLERNIPGVSPHCGPAMIRKRVRGMLNSLLWLFLVSLAHSQSHDHKSTSSKETEEQNGYVSSLMRSKNKSGASVVTATKTA